MDEKLYPFAHPQDQVSQVRVCVIEDDPDLRTTLAQVVRLSPALHLVGDFESGERALRLLPEIRPQVAVVDLQLPGMDGFELTRAIRRMLPDCEVLVLTMRNDAEAMFQALRAGATGYLLKSRHTRGIVQAILDVWNGGAPMSAAVARKVVESFRASGPDSLPLTRREEQILDLLSRGHLNKEIADATGVAETTVRFHLKNIYRKLEVNSRTEAVVAYLDFRARSAVDRPPAAQSPHLLPTDRNQAAG